MLLLNIRYPLILLRVEGKTNRIVGYRHGEYVDFDIEEALGMQKGIPAYQYEISKKLSL